MNNWATTFLLVFLISSGVPPANAKRYTWRSWKVNLQGYTMGDWIQWQRGHPGDDGIFYTDAEWAQYYAQYTMDEWTDYWVTDHGGGIPVAVRP